MTQEQINVLVQLMEDAAFDGDCDFCWKEKRAELVGAFPELEAHLPKTKYPEYERPEGEVVRGGGLTFQQVDSLLKTVYEPAVGKLFDESPLLKYLRDK